MDDEQRRSILDRLSRIKELRLALDIAIGEGKNAIETDQRRVADSVDEIVVLGHSAIYWGCKDRP